MTATRYTGVSTGVEMEREEIYQRLNEQIPNIQRRKCTPRVMSESGVDALLDQLIILQKEEDQWNQETTTQ